MFSFSLHHMTSIVHSYYRHPPPPSCMSCMSTLWLKVSVPCQITVSLAVVSIFTLPECVLAVNPGQRDRDSSNPGVRRGRTCRHQQCHASAQHSCMVGHVHLSCAEPVAHRIFLKGNINNLNSTHVHCLFVVCGKVASGRECLPRHTGLDYVN